MKHTFRHHFEIRNNILQKTERVRLAVYEFAIEATVEVVGVVAKEGFRETAVFLRSTDVDINLWATDHSKLFSQAKY